jgi:hypothetical protein
MMITATHKWSVSAIPASVLGLWVFLLIANLIDVAATAQAFAMGVAEANPISAWIAERWGVTGLTVHKLIWLAAIVFLLPHIRGWTYALLGFACAVYAGLLVVHGAYLIVL